MALVTYDSARLKTIILAGSGGLTQAIVGHPLDSIKVRLQTNATKQITRQLYRGVLPPLISSPTAWILNFGLYQKSLQIFKSNDLWNIVFAGGLAGFAWATIICPFEIVKCYSQRYHLTSSQSFNYIRSSIGYTGMYRGFTSCLVRDVPLSGVYFGVLEGCRKYIPQYNESKFLYPFITGSICGVSSWLVGLPGDCIKSQIQTNFAGLNEKLQYGNMIETQETLVSTSFIQNWKGFINKNGYLGLYKGVLPVVSRGVLTAGCCIVVVEYVNRALFQK